MRRLAVPWSTTRRATAPSLLHHNSLSTSLFSLRSFRPSLFSSISLHWSSKSFHSSGIRLGKRSPTRNDVELADYILFTDLCSEIKMTKLKVYKLIVKSGMFAPWWPIRTERQLKAGGNFALIDHIILSRQQAAAVVRLVPLKKVVEVDTEDHPCWREDERLDKEEQGSFLRPCLLTVMGHIDHGKTSLVDALRHSATVDIEAGLITQDVYAHCVLFQRNPVNSNESGSISSSNSMLCEGPAGASNGEGPGLFRITSAQPSVASLDAAAVLEPNTLLATFLDTPGHQHFSAMRDNGAYFADLVLLMVAADHGCQAQTIQSAKMALNYGSRVIVVINKMDTLPPPMKGRGGKLEHPQVTKIKKKLVETGLKLVAPLGGGDATEMGEDACPAVYGKGGVIPTVVEVSVKTGWNMAVLRQVIWQHMEALREQKTEDKPSPLLVRLAGCVRGGVVEAWNDQRGNCMKVVLLKGQLKVGDYFLAGSYWSRVQILLDEFGMAMPVVSPGVPFVVISTVNGLPHPCDEFRSGTKEAVEALATDRKLMVLFEMQDHVMADPSMSTRDEEDLAVERHDAEAHAPTQAAGITLEGELSAKNKEKNQPGREEQYEGQVVPVLIRTGNAGLLQMVMSSVKSRTHSVDLIDGLVGRPTTADVLKIAGSCPLGLRFLYCLRTAPTTKQVLQKAAEHNVEIRRFDVYLDMWDAIDKLSKNTE